jgi:hypothetical protein
MKRFSQEQRARIRQLRSQGKTFGEIQAVIGVSVPKSTLSYICSDVRLPLSYHRRISLLILSTIHKARIIGTQINRMKREMMFQEFKKRNTPIARKIHDAETGKIALAMLCLGEASKYNAKKPSSFSLGNSDPRIICLFLDLLKQSFISFDIEKIRCGVQCRADQNPEELKTYWMEITGVPDRLFYKPLIDPRTKGKPTLKTEYKGVLRVYYFDSRVHLELESLADLVYNELHSVGPVVYR